MMMASGLRIVVIVFLIIIIKNSQCQMKSGGIMKSIEGRATAAPNGHCHHHRDVRTDARSLTVEEDYDDNDDILIVVVG